MFDEKLKKAITRFIKLNQPTSLRKLLIEFQQIGQEDINIIDLLIYLRDQQVRNKICLTPNIFDKDWFKEYHDNNIHKLTIDDFLSDRIKIQITIPDYISFLWKQWIIKKILQNDDKYIS